MPFDILIFTETYTRCCKYSDLAIPNFSIQSRYDDYSGVVVKNDSFIEKLDPTIEIVRGDKFLNVLLHFIVEKTNIITGYKSPRTPLTALQLNLKRIFDRVNLSDPCVLIGDFNINTIEDNAEFQTLEQNLDFRKSLLPNITINNYIADRTTVRLIQFSRKTFHLNIVVFMKRFFLTISQFLLV